MPRNRVANAVDGSPPGGWLDATDAVAQREIGQRRPADPLGSGGAESSTADAFGALRSREPSRGDECEVRLSAPDRFVLMRLELLVGHLAECLDERVLDSFGGPKELFDRGGAAEGHVSRRVAALVDHRKPAVADLTGEVQNDSCHTGEPKAVDHHDRERVEHARIEAARDEDDL